MENLNLEIFRILHERVLTLGSDDSGAYNYYKVKLETPQEIMRTYDVWVPRLISQLEPSKVTYVGSGFAFAGFALSVLGINTVAIECDRRRYAGMIHFYDQLSKCFPIIMDKFHPKFDLFPTNESKLNPPKSNELLLFCNFVASVLPDLEDQVIGEFYKYKYVLLSEQLFVNHNDTVASRQKLRDKILERTQATRRELDENFALYTMTTNNA